MTQFECPEPSKEVQDKFSRNLFSIIFEAPPEVKTIEQAIAWGLCRGMGLTMQEVSKDSNGIHKNLLIALIKNPTPDLADLFPNTVTLISEFMPYFEKFGLTAEDLARTLIDPDTFAGVCSRAAGEDPELQAIARDMKKLAHMTEEEFKSANEENFKEEY